LETRYFGAYPMRLQATASDKNFTYNKQQRKLQDIVAERRLQMAGHII